jgi:N-acyl-D-glutamate deacylase
MKDQEPIKGVNPGQPIRFETVASRFEPLDESLWMKSFYASPVDFGGGVPGMEQH